MTGLEFDTYNVLLVEVSGFGLVFKNKDGGIGSFYNI